MGLDDGYRIKETKKGFKNTDAKTLKKIQKKHTVVPLIQKWIEVDTLIDKYLAKLPEFVKRDGRIHASLSMTTVAHSGRLAARKPNILAQPVRTKAGREIRNGYVAEDGFSFVSCDFSQIEMRICAHLSQDAAMLKTFLSSGDIHTDTAMQIFGIRDKSLVDEMKHRYPSKRVGFGILYGLTAIGLAEQLQAEVGPEWTEDRCQELIDNWYEVHYGVRDFMNSLYAFTRRNGYTTDMWGRMTYMPGVCSVFENTRNATLREAGNMPIQSSAQGVIKEAMRRLWVHPTIRVYYSQGKLYFIIQIHDDLFHEIKKEIIIDVLPLIRSVMESSTKLCVPTPVDFKMGTRWGSMEKIK
jgi:DNA polymerase-1